MRGEWDKGGMERKCFIDLFYILRQFRGKRYAIYVNYLKNIQKNDILGWNYPLFNAGGRRSENRIPWFFLPLTVGGESKIIYIARKIPVNSKGRILTSIRIRRSQRLWKR
ncbi:MAG: hypothetical protein OSJ38_11850 [Lachnospiraceae bacterium]|nr:hypothetical protein [Lachnospiraceae bacterium]